VKDRSLIYFFFASSLLHGSVIPVVLALMPTSPLELRPNLIPIDLIHVPGQEEKKETAALPKRGSTKSPKSAPQQARLAEQSKPQAAPEPAKTGGLEGKKKEHEEIRVPSFSTRSGGGSQIGSGGGDTGNLSANGDVALGSGSGGATTTIGSGRGASAPGVSERPFRPAKPLQTARATYPPMALRMGLEANVTLKVLVDNEGRVIKAQVLKSAGMGFDEEAVKAITLFRFAPAIKDGVTISSEFTYISKFRLEK
jgi:protein TonB